MQFDTVNLRGGANRVSLKQAQANFRRFGKSDADRRGESDRRARTSADEPGCRFEAGAGAVRRSVCTRGGQREPGAGYSWATRVYRRR